MGGEILRRKEFLDLLENVRGGRGVGVDLTRTNTPDEEGLPPTHDEAEPEDRVPTLAENSPDVPSPEYLPTSPVADLSPVPEEGTPIAETDELPRVEIPLHVPAPSSTMAPSERDGAISEGTDGTVEPVTLSERQREMLNDVPWQQPQPLRRRVGGPDVTDISGSSSCAVPGEARGGALPGVDPVPVDQAPSAPMPVDGDEVLPARSRSRE